MYKDLTDFKAFSSFLQFEFTGSDPVILESHKSEIIEEGWKGQQYLDLVSDFSRELEIPENSILSSVTVGRFDFSWLSHLNFSYKEYWIKKQTKLGIKEIKRITY